MSWVFAVDRLGASTRIRVTRDGRAQSFAAVFAGWAEPEVALAWSTMLAARPEAAVHWELPGLVRSGLDDPFECVLVPNERLDRVQPEPDTFAEHFGEPLVSTFTNLRGDSVLVAPRPVRGDEDYAHLLRFLRTAPPDQQAALWAAVSSAMGDALGSERRWLSTAGMGVYWLHVRIDPRPKYYRHRPYRG